MIYLVNTNISEEVDDSLTDNIIGAAIDAYRILELVPHQISFEELERVKALAVERSKVGLYYNIGSLLIVQPREL